MPAAHYCPKGIVGKDIKKGIRALEKGVIKLESKKAEADAAAAASLMQEEVHKRVAELIAEGKSLDDILKKLN